MIDGPPIRSTSLRAAEIPLAFLNSVLTVENAFAGDTGNLIHESGKFFSIEGITVRTNWGQVPEWDQPIINQPEIGLLGILAKRINGILHFLMQAKIEPGNINLVQISPTLQATKSNAARVHKGNPPHYLDYFTAERRNVRVLLDQLPPIPTSIRRWMPWVPVRARTVSTSCVRRSMRTPRCTAPTRSSRGSPA